MSDRTKLYVTPGCPFCAAAREDLEWRGEEFDEYDVSSDADALARMLTITGGIRTVPVIAAPGEPVRIGWMGAGCNI